MLDWLKKTATKASGAAAEYAANQAWIEALLELPEQRLISALRERLESMDGGALTRFIAAIGVTSAGAFFKVQRLSPKYATQYAKLRPATLPTESKARAAVERLYKMEALVKYVYAYASGNEGASTLPIATSPPSREVLEAEVARLLQDFETELQGGKNWKDCQALFDQSLKALFEGVAPSDRSRDIQVIVCRGLLESYRIGRSRHPPEFAHIVEALEGIAQAAESALKSPEGSDLQRVGISAGMRRHFQTLDTLFVDKLWLGSKLEKDPYAKLLGFHFREIGRALLSNSDLMDIGPSRDLDEHKRLVDRFHSAMMVFAEHSTDAAKLLTYEQNVFRPLAVDARAWLRRSHVFLATPQFPIPPTRVDPNAVFYSGGDCVKSILERSGSILGLHLSEPQRNDNVTHARWNQLRASHIAVFDFSSYNHVKDDGKRYQCQADEDFRASAATATVAYELGWAYALGTPIVVVESRDQPAPFDVDVAPVRIDSESDSLSSMLEGIWRALYAPQHAGLGTSVPAIVKYVQRQYAEHPKNDVRTMAASVVNVDYRRNTVSLCDALQGLASVLGAEAPEILRPTFPGRYPDSPVLFFAGAFRNWAKPAQDAARIACKQARMEFRIGYERIQHDIIRAIWDDLCSATHIVVDITGLNPNALQELAMAQAIGRNVLIVSQDHMAPIFFTPVAKLRIHQYDPADMKSMANLHSVLELFVSNNRV